MGINTPTVLFSDLINRKIYLQYIDNSAQLKEVLKLIYYSDINNHEKLIEKIVFNLGDTLAKLHNCNIIHGDLTTSNMLLKIK
jgi:tRNA A-37 threonylcarbamoyl transferase component Bud32